MIAVVVSPATQRRRAVGPLPSPWRRNPAQMREECRCEAVCLAHRTACMTTAVPEPSWAAKSWIRSVERPMLADATGAPSARHSSVLPCPVWPSRHTRRAGGGMPRGGEATGAPRPAAASCLRAWRGWRRVHSWRPCSEYF